MQKIHTKIGTARIVAYAEQGLGNGTVSVCECVFPSVCVSKHGIPAANPLPQACCCWLGGGGRRYRSIAARPALRSSGVQRVNAGNATMSAYAGS